MQLCNNICSYRSCSRARNHTGYWCCGMMIPAMYAQYCQHIVFCLSFFNGCQNPYIKYDSKGMMGNFVERFICVIRVCINCNICVWCWLVDLSCTFVAPKSYFLLDAYSNFQVCGHSSTYQHRYFVSYWQQSLFSHMRPNPVSHMTTCGNTSPLRPSLYATLFSFTY